MCGSPIGPQNGNAKTALGMISTATSDKKNEVTAINAEEHLFVY